MKTVLGKKIGMTQIFTEEGIVIPVTVVEAGPVVITQVKTVKTDGYNAVQIGYEKAKESALNKPLKGHFKKSDIEAKRYLAEFKVEDNIPYEIGQTITVADFEEGKKVDVTGTSKGKGTQGAIKRHGQARGPMGHGSKHHRLIGSRGASSTPSRVIKGLNGPGRTGFETITTQNLVIAKILPEKNIMLIKGAVPGPKGSLLKIRDAIKVGRKNK
ncbi:MAG: 50S ribosomal protein L3 [Peptostreptococcales bacterium]